MLKIIKKISIFIFLILLLIVGGIFLWKNEKKEKPKVDVSSVAIPAVNVPPVIAPVLDEGVPPEYIVIEETPEGKIVKNTKKGISMKIPEGWEVNKFVVDEDLEIRKFGPGQYTKEGGIINSGLVDGAIIKIYIHDNLKESNIKKIVDTCPILITEDGSGEIIEEKKIECNLLYETIGNTEISKTITKAMNEGKDDYGNPIFKEDSRETEIAFTKNKKVYFISCEAVGKLYEEHSQECEKIIKDKIKNEF